MNKLDVAKLFRSAKLWTTKHSPEILTGIGIAGMVTTTVLAVKATPKALILLEDAEYEKKERLTALEAVKVAWKPYIPAAVTGIASMACLIGASSVSARRNAALATAYQLSTTALSEYKEQVIETIGEKKEELVREKVSQKQLDKLPVTNNEILMTGNGTSLCLDPLSKRLFTCDIEVIRKAEIALNKQMQQTICGSVSLNDFYNEIGLEPIDIGDDLGWNANYLIDLDDHPGKSKDDKLCWVIGHNNAPIYGY